MLKLIPRKPLPQRPAHPLQIFASNLVIIGHHRITGDIALAVCAGIIREQADQHRLRSLRYPLHGAAGQTGLYLLKAADSKRERLRTCQQLLSHLSNNFFLFHPILPSLAYPINFITPFLHLQDCTPPSFYIAR